MRGPPRSPRKSEGRDANAKREVAGIPKEFGKSNPKEMDRLQHLAVERSRMHIPQLYIHQRAGSASRPVRQLEGFRRVTLQPGETSTLRFPLRRDELKFWSPRTKRWVVEPSIFDVWAGEDSRADLHAELTIEP